MVVGAKNSAAIAALELFWTGARVTLVHRGPEIHRHVKYWIKPNIENRIKNGEVKAYFNSHVVEIRPKSVILDTPEGRIEVKNDFVFAMIGYSPDMTFLNATGITLDPVSQKPRTESRYPRKRAKRHLPGGSDRGRHAHQRDLHRKRPLPRRQIALLAACAERVEAIKMPVTAMVVTNFFMTVSPYGGHLLCPS
jgi:thioredoxin reductase (NADPH)